MKKHLLINAIILLYLTACSGSSDNESLNANQSPSITIPDAIVMSDKAFQTDHFSGSQNCVLCHNRLIDENNNDVSIEKDWGSTMMANAARDPLFRAKMASETLRNPALKSLIENKCSRCHTPMANVEAHSKNQTVKLLPPGFLSADHELYDAAMDGVSCTVCHQIEDTAELGTDAGFTGNFSINSLKNIYGPFINPMGTNMTQVSGYTPVQSSHISDSKLCSACHNLYTNIIDINTGEDTGNVFPEQNIYNEWEQSRFSKLDDGKSCQDCHMPETNGVIVSSLGPASITARDNFSKHYFVGGNTYMLDIFNKNKTTLGVSGNNFDETIARTRDLLKSAATLSLTKTSNDNGSLDFTVNIKNLSGHKLPSGYPARRAYLHVTVKNSNSEIVFESGKLNENGSIAGVDADQDPTQYEKHHNLITSSDQVQVYESIMGDTNNDITYTLLNGATYLKDNRLLPEGLDKTVASTDVAPGSLALADDNFINAGDEVDYQIPLNSNQDYTVEVELNYQSLAYRYAQDLFTDIDKHDYINTFKTLYDDASNIQKETIASTNTTIKNLSDVNLDSNIGKIVNNGNSAENEKWSAATLALQSYQNNLTNTVLHNDPQLVIDTLGNTTVKLSISQSNIDNGLNNESTENQIVRTSNGLHWTDTLSDSTMFDDLSTNAQLESIQVASLTGAQFGLIRDSNKLYLAQYKESTGWSKLEIPEVPVNINKNNIQIAISEAGMISIVWLEQIENSFNASINAKHFVVDSGWEITQSIVVAYDNILTPHLIDKDGNIHITWLVSNSSSANGYSVKMAIYTSMQGWSEVLNGPDDIRSIRVKTTSGPYYRVIADIDNNNTQTINAYVIGHDGNWIKFTNINNKTIDDQQKLANWQDVHLAMGDQGQFVVAWREIINNNAQNTLRYKTALATPKIEQEKDMDWTTPSLIDSSNTNMETQLRLAIANAGDLYAVWVSNTDQLYVNHATSSGVWDLSPDILADYTSENMDSVQNPKIAVDTQNNVSIIWDQYSQSNSAKNHNIWWVKSK